MLQRCLIYSSGKSVADSGIALTVGSLKEPSYDCGNLVFMKP